MHPSHITELPSFRTIDNRGNFNRTIHRTDTIQTQAVCLPCIYLLRECYWLVATTMTTDCWPNNEGDRMRLAFGIILFAGYKLPFFDQSFRSSKDTSLQNSFQQIYQFAFISFLPQAFITAVKILFRVLPTHRTPTDTETWNDIEVDG